MEPDKTWRCGFKMVDKNKQLFHGCIDVEKREKGYLAKRFTPKQFERYTKMPWCIYPYCTAGVFMEFVTAAEEISFDYYFSQLFLPPVVFDIFENDTYMAFIKEPDCSTSGHITYRKKTPGAVRMRIYLPYTGETHISNIKFGDFKVTRNRRKIKLLVYGDSISQGLMGSHPYMSYVPLISDVIGADYLNLSVGGDLFDYNMIEPALPFEPTVIIVALGTNDLPFIGDYKKIKKNMNCSLQNSAKYIRRFRSTLLLRSGRLILSALKRKRNAININCLCRYIIKRSKNPIRQAATR